MVSNQSVPFLSKSIARLPSGASGLNFFTGYSVSFKVFGSNLEMNGLPKSEYQTTPSRAITSCGSITERGMEYSVTIALVERPVGRGRVLRSYAQWSVVLRLMVAR